ncbi:conserved hypothetical protein [Ricinus communis]|uniref:Uncharacterized protein n=1 Tax=Ricinus communis TaxID=3988 RepID=B9TIS4_RICCO|nr:conserved hypothetical protein [Ricinus communis]
MADRDFDTPGTRAPGGRRPSLRAAQAPSAPARGVAAPWREAGAEDHEGQLSTNPLRMA